MWNVCRLFRYFEVYITFLLTLVDSYAFHTNGRVITLLPFNASGYAVYHQVQHSTILRSAHTMYLRFSCGSENGERLVPYTALTGWCV